MVICGGSTDPSIGTSGFGASVPGHPRISAPVGAWQQGEAPDNMDEHARQALAESTQRVELIVPPSSEYLRTVRLVAADAAVRAGLDCDEIPVVRGSALKALQAPSKFDDPIGAGAIVKLLEAVDKYIPMPTRDVDKPFLMPVEDVFSIKGRGTVGTGRIERGIVRVGDAVEIVGMRAESMKSTCTGAMSGPPGLIVTSSPSSS